MQHELILVGGGSGSEAYLLPIAKEALETVDCVIASERFLDRIAAKKKRPMGNLSQLLDELPALLEQEQIAILVSGDPLLYSLCRTIQNHYPELPMRVIPGISSLQLLGTTYGITMEDAVILSIHGRYCKAGTIACAVAQHSVTCFFCSQTQGAKEIATALQQYGLAETQLYVGSDLTYPTQKLQQGKPSDFLDWENPPLCVAIVKNSHPEAVSYPALLPDSAFFRNASPMTKEEVRAVILSKLRLRPDATVWDIGAGTGSVSVECARMCPFGSVYAVEYQPAALEILEKNKAYFQTKNLCIVEGRAEAILKHLPVPDCVFIGGSGRGLSSILEQIQNLPQKIRIVLSAVTLETQAEAYTFLQDLLQFEAVQLAVSRAKPVGSYRVLEGNHPVMLFSCETKE